MCPSPTPASPVTGLGGRRYPAHPGHKSRWICRLIRNRTDLMARMHGWRHLLPRQADAAARARHAFIACRCSGDVVFPFGTSPQGAERGWPGPTCHCRKTSSVELPNRICRQAKTTSRDVQGEKSDAGHVSALFNSLVTSHSLSCWRQSVTPGAWSLTS